jgi:hypothetical protein
MFVEYPPGAFGALLPPALLPDDAYRPAFKVLMAVVGIGILVVAALVLVRLGVGRRRLYLTLGALALAPLALGPVSLNTYDAWPTLLVAAAVCALLYERPVFAFGLLGLAVTAKLYPAALLPVFCLAVPVRALARSLTAFAGVVAAVVLPFALFGWEGLRESLEAQSGRALQLESLGGALLAAGDRLGIYEATVTTGSTAALSRDLAGSLPDALAVAGPFLQVAAVAAVVWFFATGVRDGERLVVASAATLVGFIAFSRFISPQYLVWALPLVVLAAPPAGVVAGTLVGAAMVLGQLWFFHYRDVFALEGIVWLVLIRDLLLVGAYCVLVLRLRTKTPSSSSTVSQAPLSSRRASGAAAVEGSERRSR